ncbi:MAG: zinc-dependent metalloprotease [Chloroflexi bacterium]|nr:zinc-dependent metalloprotease [Chloroflexota bacterium]MCL5026945.1 zinc-dependent metalloprotease [Chloroflexota bacterium]
MFSLFWRLIRFGTLAAGLAAGVWVLNRRLRNLAPRLIDWDNARRIALRIAQRDYIWVDWSFDYRSLVAQAQQAVASYVNERLPRDLDTVYVYDRAEWLDVNINNFRWLLEPLERLNQQSIQTGAFGARLVAAGGQFVLTNQMGLLLGYLARRVLGQYDLALLGKSPVSTGKLYFVEPNIVMAQQQLRVDGYQFRQWIALHETTHAYEFEAHPWLRDYMNELLSRYLESLSSYLTGRAHEGGNLLTRFVASVSTSQHLLELVMTQEQRALFRQLQAVMSLIEGYSNHVMNQVGQSILPDYQRIRQRFEQRTKQRTLVEQIFSRLTGLEVKRQQYEQGQRFVDEVVRQRGLDFMHRVWAGPASLPTLDEIRNPGAWIRRMETAQGEAQP